MTGGIGPASSPVWFAILATMLCWSGCDSGSRSADAGATGDSGTAACSAATVIAVDTSVAGELVMGDVGAHDATCLGESDQPDALFAVEHAAGLLSVRVETNFWHPAVELRADCQTPNPEYCEEVAGAGFGHDRYTVQKACVESGTTYVLVDGVLDSRQAESAGAVAPFFVSPSLYECASDETCHDVLACGLRVDPGDSCSDAVSLPPGRKVIGDARQTGDDLAGFTCFASEGADASGDAVYLIDVAGSASLAYWAHAAAGQATTASRTALRAVCDDPATELACGPHPKPLCVDAGTYALIFDSEIEAALRVDVNECAADEPCQRGFCLPPLTAELEPNDAPASAQSIESGQFVGAHFDQEDDVDFYRINLSAGDTVRISTVLGCDADTVVMLFAGPLAGPPNVLGPNCFQTQVEPLLCLDNSDASDGYSVCADGEWTASADTELFIRVSEVEYINPYPVDESHDYVLNVEVM